MPYIRVNPKNLRSVSETLREIQLGVGKIEESFYSVSVRLDWDIKREQDINWMLQHIQRELEEETHILSRMSGFIGNAAVQYEQLGDLKYNQKNPSSTVQGNRNGGGGGSDSGGERAPKSFWKFFIELTERSKNVTKGIGKISDGETIGFSSDILDYFNNLVKFFAGDEKEKMGIGQWCKLADSSSSLWKGFYDILQAGFSDEQLKKLFETKFGATAAGIGIGGSLVGLIGSMIQASKTHEWNDIADIGKSATDVGKELYLVGNANPVKYAAHCYTSIIKSGMDFTGQVAESINKYSQDGEWSVGDTGATGVEASIKGLNTLVSGFTYGIISLEAINTSPEEVSQNLENWAEKLGEDIGNYIVKSKLRTQYQMSGAQEQRRILLGAAKVRSIS